MPSETKNRSYPERWQNLARDGKLVDAAKELRHQSPTMDLPEACRRVKQFQDNHNNQYIHKE